MDRTCAYGVIAYVLLKNTPIFRRKVTVETDFRLPEAEADWLRLLRGYDVADEPAQAAFKALARHYQSPGRVYHTLEHILQVLANVTALAPHAENVEAVQLAAWFHDVIYEPGAARNEAQSADYAATVLTVLDLPQLIIDEVRRLILLTETHRTTANDGNGHVLLDADLAILGAAPPVYEAYAQAIRAEFARVDDETYRKGRLRVLHGLLERTFIYYTTAQRADRERQARHNIRAEIEALSENG